MHSPSGRLDAAVALVTLALAGTAQAAAPTSAPVDATALKQQRAQAIAENGLITQVNTAEAAKDWPKAESALQQLLALNPSRWQYRQALADAELHQRKYAEAAEAYAAALHGALLDKTKFRQALAAIYTNEGAAYLNLKRGDEAVAAFEHAVPYSDNPAVAWFNVCATAYNVGQVQPALSACDKAIAADPQKADAYFIKGSLLVGEAGTDAAGKAVAPPGAADALHMYLKLAPAGPHADDVKQMLDFIEPSKP